MINVPNNILPRNTNGSPHLLLPPLLTLVNTTAAPTTIIMARSQNHVSTLCQPGPLLQSTRLPGPMRFASLAVQFY